MYGETVGTFESVCCISWVSAVEPSCEEDHLNVHVDECTVLINLQLLNDSVQDVLNCCMLNAVMAAIFGQNSFD